MHDNSCAAGVIFRERLWPSATREAFAHPLAARLRWVAGPVALLDLIVIAAFIAGMWWSIVTLATIAYGDSVPTTLTGKIGAAFTALIGVGEFAVPTAILTGAVIEGGHRAEVCPHGGNRGICLRNRRSAREIDSI